MIDKFRGEYAFLSNFYECPVEYEGLIYNSAEAAFQAAKTDVLNEKMRFTNLSPAEAKKAGKRLNLRPDWESVKVDIMREIVRSKFERNAELKALLIETGEEEIVEGNTWNDRFWGVCKGSGQNYLGKILMEARKELSKRRLGALKGRFTVPEDDAGNDEIESIFYGGENDERKQSEI